MVELQHKIQVIDEVIIWELEFHLSFLYRQSLRFADTKFIFLILSDVVDNSSAASFFYGWIVSILPSAL